MRATGKVRRHITHKFDLESGWEVRVINLKGPHAGKFSVKYNKDDPNWRTHSLLRVVRDVGFRDEVTASSTRSSPAAGNRA